MLDTVVRALTRSDLFSSLNEAQLRKVAQRGELFQASEGEVVLAEGDPSGAFFLVLNGSAAVQSGDAIINVVGVADVVGEMGVLLGQPRTATVIAQAPMILLRFDAAVFDAMFERIPGFGMAICRALALRLADVNLQLDV